MIIGKKAEILRCEVEGRCWTVARITIPSEGASLAVLPMLVFRERDGSDRMAMEFLDFAEQARHFGQREGAIAAVARTIGRLTDYHVRTNGAPIETTEELYALCRRYLSARYHGTIYPETGECPFGLWWRPIRPDTLLNDRRGLERFFTHTAKLGGKLPFLGGTAKLFLDAAIPPNLSRLMRARRSGLLGHLADRRKLTPTYAPLRLPGGMKVTTAVRRGGSGGGHLRTEQIEEMIAKTPQPLHRMILIHAAFGGPRISEQMHMWVDDVLPPEHRAQLFSSILNDAFPVVVIAHPAESRWTGQIGEYSRSRIEVLSDRGLRPRNLLPATQPQYAGWKGYAFNNEDLRIGLTLWSNLDRAREYLALCEEVLDERRRALAAESHPYLHVNLDRRSADYGRPMTISGAKKVFERACLRVGITPHTNHATIHRLRSHYAAQVRRAVGGDFVHDYLHQYHPGSADDYGRSISETHTALAAIAGRDVSE